MVVDTISNELLTPEGRKIMTNRIMDGLNEYLVEEGLNPDIHYVYIINYNIV
jgi:flagellar basal body-associated protein FliL